MGKFIDLTGQQFGNWKVLLYDKNTKKWVCECQCTAKTKRLVASADLRNGKTTNCGCKRKNDLTGKEFKHLIVDSYAGDYHWNCHCKECNRQFKVHTYHLEHGNIPVCNHNGLHANVDDITGKQFNDWTVLSYAGNKYWNCICSCGVEKKIIGRDLKSGVSKSCGHSYPRMKALLNSDNKFIDLTGKQFGEWSVIEYTGNHKWKCECSCGNIGYINSAVLRSGGSKSCGHNSGKLKDITEQIFGELEAKEYIGDGKWRCLCSCGEETIVRGTDLRNGHIQSCGSSIHRYTNIKGQKFNEFTAVEYLGKGYWNCKCSCGNTRKISISDLRAGRKKSCGCKQYEYRNQAMVKKGIFKDRTKEQIDALKSRENMLKFIGTNTYTIQQLSRALGVNPSYMSHICTMYNLYDTVQKNSGKSQLELDLYNYIKSIYNGDVIQHDRSLLKGKELDIYIPDKKLAIEFNGTYWHCDELVGKNYHQEKSIECIQHGVQLIHIFEYEWLKDYKQNLIKQLLKDKLCESKIYYARQLSIKEVTKKDEEEFLNKYHIQGFSGSKTAIGLYDNNELLSIMTFGVPRFDRSADCELIRMCFKAGISIVGGAERMLKHYIDTYKPLSIISYCDLAKFNGNSYFRLGFTTSKENLTSPNYVWVSPDRNEVLPRYQTQKQKLVNLGLDAYGDTEDEIMKNLEYLKIYDSGNLKFIWYNK